MSSGSKDTQTYDGSIHCITGPMFSGKSTELIRLARRRLVAKETVLVLKWHKDNRYSERCAATHDEILMDAVRAKRLMDHWTAATNVQNIFIDEAQFFPDVGEFCEELANAGKTVVVACLDTMFNRKPWAGVPELLSLAESAQRLSAVCMQCHSEAHFSKRLTDEADLVVVGGAEKYAAVCRQCWHT